MEKKRKHKQSKVKIGKTPQEAAKNLAEAISGPKGKYHLTIFLGGERFETDTNNIA